MSSPERPWGPARIALWALAAVLASVWFGPAFVAAFQPPKGLLLDFIQEWLSAKNYWSGTPVYADQTEALFRHTGMTPEQSESMLPWNAHPPASILLALPFAALPYERAQLVWNLATFPLFVLSIVMILRELNVPLRPASLLPAVVLTLACHPLYIQLAQGQLNTVLLFLLVLTWVAERRRYAAWAGVALGAAAAIKLFPAFVFLYFVLARRWRALATGTAAFLALNGIALALFGVSAFETYIREVVPSVAQYQTNWRNVSLTGFWLRVFDPQEKERVIALVRAPLAGRVVANLFRLVVTLAAARACWRARGGGTDRAFAVTLTATLLVSPISWTHYFLLLALPVALVWMRTPAGPKRWAMWAVFVVLWLPDNFPAALILGRERIAAMNRDRHQPLSPTENLYAVAVNHYALFGLFLLTLLVPTRRPEPNEPGDPTEESEDELLNRRLYGTPDAPAPPGLQSSHG